MRSRFEAHLGRGGTLVQLADTTNLPQAGSIAVRYASEAGVPIAVCKLIFEFLVEVG